MLSTNGNPHTSMADVPVAPLSGPLGGNSHSLASGRNGSWCSFV